MIEQYEYCARQIAEGAKTNTLGISSAYIFEDAKLRGVDLLGDHRALPDCVEYFNDVASGMQQSHRLGEEPSDGYAIPPYGPNSSFGYDGTAACWIMLVPMGTVLVSRAGDDQLDEYIGAWCEHWLFHDKPRFKWPTKNTINDALDTPLFENLGNGPPAMLGHYMRDLRRNRKNAIKSTPKKRSRRNGRYLGLEYDRQPSG